MKINSEDGGLEPITVNFVTAQVLFVNTYRYRLAVHIAGTQ